MFYFTRVLEVPDNVESGHFYVAQEWSIRKPFAWRNIPPISFDDKNYDAISGDAKRAAEKHGGLYVGVSYRRKKQPNRLLKKLRKLFSGIEGRMGAPGVQGARGDRGERGAPGPAYDDIECPNCEKRRSETGATLFMEVLGDHKFGYTCPHCKTTSTFITSNGVWVLLKPTEE